MRRVRSYRVSPVFKVNPTVRGTNSECRRSRLGHGTLSVRGAVCIVYSLSLVFTLGWTSRSCSTKAQ